MWKCNICNFFLALTLRLLLRHICSDHSFSTNFKVTCNVEFCDQSYTKYNSYYRHVMREHNNLLNSPGETTQLSLQNNIDSVENDQQQNITSNTESDNDQDNDVSMIEVNHEIGNDTDFIFNHMNPNLENAGLEIDELETEQQTEAQENADQERVLEIDNHDLDKRRAVEYIMNLKEFHKIRETTAEAIAIGTNGLCQKVISSLQERVKRTCRNAGIDTSKIDGFNDAFDMDMPFNSITTRHERNNYIQSNFYYVVPTVVEVGQRLQEVRKQGVRQLDMVTDSYRYFPICQSIEQFLQNDGIYRLTRIEPTTFPGFYTGISSGNIFKENNVFQMDVHALQIQLYFDDLEICNPMSKRAGVHKIGMFYYSIANLPQKLSSRLPAIRLLAIVERSVINRYNLNIVLEKIKDDLNLLATGISINICGQQHFTRGACLCFIGDTLACHEFGGFKLGVGFSHKKCRECECTFQDMQIFFDEKHFTKRTLERYDEQCNEIASAESNDMKKLLSTTYGINFRSAACDFPHFDITKMIPQDIMHVVFEGFAVYETKAVLQNLVKRKILTLQQLNSQIENFDYGYRDRASQPGPIPAKIFNADDSNLRQSASSMIVLLRLLPFILVEKLNCDPHDAYLAFLIELCEIVLIIMSPVVSHESVSMLKVMISNHLKQFKELFPNMNILPKQHYAVHLPSTIERYGALTNVWGMRFEGKHQAVKQQMSGSHCFKNVVASLADRCAMYECSLNTCSEHPLFKNDLQVGKKCRILQASN